MITYSIIQKSQLEGALRLDAEYYQPEYLSAVETIKKIKHERLGDITSILTDYHANGSYQILSQNVNLSENPDYALMVRAIDFKKNDYESDVRYVSRHAYDFLKKTKMYGQEIIIDKIGNAGEVFLMPNLEQPVTLGMNLFMLRLKENYEPAYVYAFLISKYGKALIYQRITGTAPPSIDKKSVRGILIPLLPQQTSQVVKAIIEDYFKTLEESKKLYSQAEDLLLQALGLAELQKEEDISYIVNFSDVQEANRIDAEYFHPKYAEVIKKIKTRKDGWDTLGNLTSLIGHPSNPPYENNSSNDKTFIITQKHLSNFFPADKFWEDTEALYTTSEFIENNTAYLLKENDIILYSVGAYIGKANIYNSNVKATIGSFLTLIRPKQELINPFCLLVFLNSPIGLLLARRNSRGLAQQYIYPYDTKTIPIPKLNYSVQQEIEKLIKKGQEAKRKSKELLEQAKREVEDMIEKESKNTT